MAVHLAQLNVGTLRYGPDDPRVAEFMDNLDRVNGIAEAMPGFVWRLKDDSNNATGIDASGHFADGMIVNMSVWETAEALERFVWQTVHKRFYQKKAAWFEAMPAGSGGDSHFVMWWVPAGHRPDLAEASAKLELLRVNGSTEEAFGWEYLPEMQLWRSQQCA
ncbi:MAG: DUF3291 domain-containing protein [Pseudomonadota bacterium]